MNEHIQLVYTDLIRVYVSIPGVLVCKIVYAVTLCLKSFPAKNGVSATLSLQAIITGQSVMFSKHCLLELREYTHNHKYRDNSMESWTLEALALRPTGNNQGRH